MDLKDRRIKPHHMQRGEQLAHEAGYVFPYRGVFALAYAERMSGVEQEVTVQPKYRDAYRAGLAAAEEARS